MSDQVCQVTITGQNQFGDALPLRGQFNLSLSGTWEATVTVQRSFDNGVSWVDVATFSANGEHIGEESEADVKYRIGVKSGGYTSGSVIGRLSQ